ncbi:MAG: 2-oxo acid dehydrogenase subunit E2 [Pirellulales bacterium]|nr:2-oxo acid dehydrogenase subunit E2 [Pirellulales bacterium]
MVQSNDPSEIRLPDLGENIDSGDVLSILVHEGDTIEKEQGIVELETDKAVVEVPSPLAGTVAKIHLSVGDTVTVGQLILTLDAPATKVPQDTGPSAEQPAPDEAIPLAQQSPGEMDTTQAPSQSPAASKIHSIPPASPAVRRLAREMGVDLTHVQGTGNNDRITKEDVLSWVRRNEATAATPRIPPSPTTPGTAVGSDSMHADPWGPVRREKLTKIRQVIATRMQESKATIPHVTNFDDADVTELERIRKSSKQDYEPSGIKLTSMPFVIKAVAHALQRHPMINASLDLENQQVIYKDYINLGVAVDTDRGLIVPVLRNVRSMGIPEIARQLATMAEQARSGNFPIEDLRGGTFTISNLGAIGGTYSTPIINPPEVAILLVGRARKMPVVLDDEIAIRTMMPLSLSYDHRFVDGAVAARFLNTIKDYLQNPARLLLAP